MENTYMSDTVTPQKLSQIPFFKDMNDEYVSLLSQKMRIIRVKKENLIISEGDTSQKMYFILEGSVAVFRKNYKGGIEKICELGSPNFFGEMTILDGGPRSASVASKTDVTLVVLDWNDIRNAFNDKPEIMSYIFKSIASTLSMRLRRLNSLYSNMRRF